MVRLYYLGMRIVFNNAITLMIEREHEWTFSKWVFPETGLIREIVYDPELIDTVTPDEDDLDGDVFNPYIVRFDGFGDDNPKEIPHLLPEEITYYSIVALFSNGQRVVFSHVKNKTTISFESGINPIAPIIGSIEIAKLESGSLNIRANIMHYPEDKQPSNHEIGILVSVPMDKSPEFEKLLLTHLQKIWDKTCQFIPIEFGMILTQIYGIEVADLILTLEKTRTANRR